MNHNVRPGRGEKAAALVLLLLLPAAARAQTVLTVDAAVEIARKHAPELGQAKASIEAAQARIDIARSPLLPQLSGSLGYERSTSNGGQTIATSANSATGISRTRISLSTRDTFSASLRANQLIYDFGQSRDSLRAAQASAKAESESARATWQQIEFSVRNAFLQAAAGKALMQVARESLENQQRHLAQIQGFVEVGTRPAIDLAQSRTEVANARLSLLRAENDYALAKSQLDRAMGHNPFGDYEVSSELPAPEPDENADLALLLQQAERNRPEFAALQHQLRAQTLNISATDAGHAPSLALSASVNEAGRALDAMALNVGAGVNLSWSIFQGGLVDARVREARASLAGLQSQRETLLKDTRLQLQQAVLSLRAAQAALEIAGEVVVNARERLTLAEGRYSAGVGNVIELGDAQLVLSDSQAQEVSAQYELGQARALLHKNLGR